ncbi:MAG: class I SAM-dependent methyltransferase, partial [Chloroflexota bacterium]
GLAGDVSGKRVCDLACGEGHLSRALAEKGALVTGVDLSQNLLEHAKRQSAGHSIHFIRDDAQTLNQLQLNSLDLVICNMALMDIPDIGLVYQAVNKILRDGGIFIFSVLHPCFETPFTVPETITEADETGNFVACRVMHYTQEGHWNSGGTGMRGTVGAHHRTLSSYINHLLKNGFQLKDLAEPTLPPDTYQTFREQWSSKIPRALIVVSEKH